MHYKISPRVPDYSGGSLATVIVLWAMVVLHGRCEIQGARNHHYPLNNFKPLTCRTFTLEISVMSGHLVSFPPFVSLISNYRTQVIIGLWAEQNL